ncbi:MAG: integrase [Gammaproteobacteria bacterium]|nr:integrase [Gammaproteobacteria bacterium]
MSAIAMNRKLYEALRSIGIKDRNAAAVSEALSEYIVGLRSDVKLLKWMVGFDIVLSLGLLWVVLQIL